MLPSPVDSAHETRNATRQLTKLTKILGVNQRTIVEVIIDNEGVSSDISALERSSLRKSYKKISKVLGQPMDDTTLQELTSSAKYQAVYTSRTRRRSTISPVSRRASVSPSGRSIRSARSHLTNDTHHSARSLRSNASRETITANVSGMTIGSTERDSKQRLSDTLHNKEPKRLIDLPSEHPNGNTPYMEPEPEVETNTYHSSHSYMSQEMDIIQERAELTTKLGGESPSIHMHSDSIPRMQHRSPVVRADKLKHLLDVPNAIVSEALQIEETCARRNLRNKSHLAQTYVENGAEEHSAAGQTAKDLDKSARLHKVSKLGKFFGKYPDMDHVALGGSTIIHPIPATARSSVSHRFTAAPASVSSMSTSSNSLGSRNLHKLQDSLSSELGNSSSLESMDAGGKVDGQTVTSKRARYSKVQKFFGSVPILEDSTPVAAKN